MRYSSPSYSFIEWKGIRLARYKAFYLGWIIAARFFSWRGFWFAIGRTAFTVEIGIRLKHL